jgi:hypothetical protein
MHSLARHPAHAQSPTGWIHRPAFWLAPACMRLGLLCWARWSVWRCLFWGGVASLMPWCVSAMIRILGLTMALSA